jgi:integrase
MGRKRDTDNGWPKGWYQKGPSIYFRLAKYKDILGPKPIRLGSSEREAFKTYAELPIHGNLTNGSTRLDDVLTRYEVEVLPGNAPRTQENKRYYIETLRKVAGHIDVRLIKQKHAWQFFDALKRKRGLKTARETIGCLRHVMSMCVRWGYVDLNLLLGMRLPKAKPRRRYVTDEELALFVNEYATPRIQAHIAIKLETGMDKQDILLIEHKDIQEVGLRHNRHKTDSHEKHYGWTDELLAAVELLKRAYRKKKNDVGSRFICKTRTGEPYFPAREENGVKRYLDENGHPFGAPSGWNSQWQRCMKAFKEAGHEGFHEHDIRKKVASDTSLVNAQELLDHSSPTITEKVYRVKPRVVKLERRKGSSTKD